MTLEEILRVYMGSDGEATKQLYARLDELGPRGEIAVNLLRASKTSERAKKYRGGGYRAASYDRKQWSIDNLCNLLSQEAERLELRWGWGLDEKQPFHRHVLYVDLPNGQVSFHTAERGEGPDAPAPVQTAQGGHIATVGTTLVAYYGSDQNTPADEPLHTATARARFAAVDATGAAPPLTEAQIARARQVADFLRAHGVWDAREFVTVGPWIVVDIGLRMLTARELASCQGFPPSYVLAAMHKGKPLTKTAQIRMIGNSVCPRTAAALVHANLVLAERMAAARDYQPWGERLKARLVARQREAERLAA